MPDLKTLLTQKPILLGPGVYDSLSALIAEQAGARSVYLSGAAIAYTRFGRSDLGLVDMTEVAQIITAIRERVTVPIVADGDNGFGNALNVQRTIRTFERAGADGIQLEDQTLPKRCGHLAGKSLVSLPEMVGKLKAAVDAREKMLIIARTDAVAVEGFDKALERAHAYADAGADVLFVEALQSVEQMRETVKSLGGRAPLMVNLIEGGKTPVLPLAELEAIGFSYAIYPAGVVRAIAKQMQDFYAMMIGTGATEGFRARMLDFNGLNGLIGTPELMAYGETYSAERMLAAMGRSAA